MTLRGPEPAWHHCSQDISDILMERVPRNLDVASIESKLMQVCSDKGEACCQVCVSGRLVLNFSRPAARASSSVGARRAVCV